jgi:redox-sensing transcriptional repressor
VIRRLPLYLEALSVLHSQLEGQAKRYVSSQQIAELSGTTPALVRKDLNFFGDFGVSGTGYHIDELRKELLRILNLEDVVNICIVGAGNLGRALAWYNIQRYERSEDYRYRSVAIFDNDPEKIGEEVAGLKVESVRDMLSIVPDRTIKIAVITVPAEAASAVCQQVVDAGIKAILNFAPTQIEVPKGVTLHNVNLSVELEHLSYYL